jgi:cell division protein FtsL
MKSEQSTPDYSQPVAYDVNGQPLYAHPPKNTHAKHSKVVHMARPVEPEKPIISDATKLKHNRSKHLFPSLNLSEGEYVITAVKRHPFGLLLPISLGSFLVILVFVLLNNYDSLIKQSALTRVMSDTSVVVLPLIMLICLILLGIYVAVHVYINNKFFLTNESVIQEIQTGIFAKTEQTVSLSNIEDASFTQNGIIEQMFNFGSIRLSTEGDETTYRFEYVANPKQHIRLLNNAIEAFKNGRPIPTDEI